jgi:hypothetical protein
VQRIFIKKCFLFTVGIVYCNTVLGGIFLPDDEEVEMDVRNWLRQQSKTSMLRVSTRW